MVERNKPENPLEQWKNSKIGWQSAVGYWFDDNKINVKQILYIQADPELKHQDQWNIYYEKFSLQFLTYANGDIKVAKVDVSSGNTSEHAYLIDSSKSREDTYEILDSIYDEDLHDSN